MGRRRGLPDRRRVGSIDLRAPGQSNRDADSGVKDPNGIYDRDEIVGAQCRGHGGSQLLVDLGDEVALQKAEHDCARHDEAEGEESRDEADELGGKRTT